MLKAFCSVLIFALNYYILLLGKTALGMLNKEIIKISYNKLELMEVTTITEGNAWANLIDEMLFFPSLVKQ